MHPLTFFYLTGERVSVEAAKNPHQKAAFSIVCIPAFRQKHANPLALVSGDFPAYFSQHLFRLTALTR
jgi:hypothetical protein